MHTARRHALLLGLAPLALAVVRPAHAQVVAYNDTTTFTGYAAFNTGAATGGTGPTTLIADDINALAGYAGRQVTQFTFSVYNGNNATTTFTPTVYFYNSDGAKGGPGTLLNAVTFLPLTEASGALNLYSPSSTAGFFTLPSGTFWAGVSFSNATAAELNNLGQGLYDPPTIGSSQDLAFHSSAPATTANNPSGGFFSGGGVVNANLGWSFTVAGAVAPEPSPFAVLGIGVLGLGTLTLRARKRRAA